MKTENQTQNQDAVFKKKSHAKEELVSSYRIEQLGLEG